MAEAVPGSKGTKKAGVKHKKSAAARLREALAEERDKSKEYWDHLQRLQADFENTRRLAEGVEGEARVKAIWDISGQLLGVADELELALAQSPKGKKEMARGVELTLRHLGRIFGEMGLRPIDALGKPFDPYRHEMVGSIPISVETNEQAEGTVVEVLRKGYTLHDQVLRPAMVKTAKKIKEEKERNKGGS